VAQKNLASTLTRSERLAFLEREDKEVSLVVQADLLSVSRASLYYQPAPPSSEELAVKRRIDEIYIDEIYIDEIYIDEIYIDEIYTAWPFYGSRRIHEQLGREGQVVNRKAVQRHMQEMGLIALGPRPGTSRRNHEQAVYPYLLRNLLRNLRCGWPNHIWGIDITYIRLQGGWVYLASGRLGLSGGRPRLVQPLRSGLGTTFWPGNSTRR